MKKMKIYDKDGYGFINEKSKGLFGFINKGTWKGASFLKIRICEIFQKKGTKNVIIQRRRLTLDECKGRKSPQWINFTPDMLPELVEILEALHKEHHGKELFKKSPVMDTIKEKPKDEVGELLRQLGAGGKK